MPPSEASGTGDDPGHGDDPELNAALVEALLQRARVQRYAAALGYPAQRVYESFEASGSGISTSGRAIRPVTTDPQPRSRTLNVGFTSTRPWPLLIDRFPNPAENAATKPARLREPHRVWSDPIWAWLRLAETQVVSSYTHHDASPRRLARESPNSCDAVTCYADGILNADKPTLFVAMFRWLKPGGWVGITDLVIVDDLTAGQRAERNEYLHHVAHGAPLVLAAPLSVAEYRDVLTRAQFTDVDIVPVYEVADAVHLAAVTAVKPIPDGTPLDQVSTIPRRRPPTLAVWDADAPTDDTTATAEFARLHATFLASDTDQPPTNRIQAFLTDLQHTSVPVEELPSHKRVPWADTPLIARGPIVQFTVGYPWAADALHNADFIAKTHNLILFDVTAGQMLQPDPRDRAT